ncbi:MAG: dockerin type I repeat-containing protein, partial [Ruminococcus sp.]
IETYRTDTNEMYDSYTINKSDRAKLDQSISKAESMIASGEYSGVKLENLKAALETAKLVQAETAENGELTKAYDAAVVLDEAINDMKPVLYGDVNGDGDVRINDAIVLQKYLAGQDVSLSKRQLEAAAVVSDGEPTVKDVTRIQQYLAEIIPSLNK